MAPTVCSSSTVDPHDFALFLHAQELTYYHEAGHAVAFYAFGFRPLRIAGALTEHDRRTTSFCRAKGGWLRTARARERAEEYAVCCIAGIAAEAKVAGVSIPDLRHTSGARDYKAVYAIAERLGLRSSFEFPATMEARIQWWESRAFTLINDPAVWKAVGEVVAGLIDNEGVLHGADLQERINDGLLGAADELAA